MGRCSRGWPQRRAFDGCLDARAESAARSPARATPPSPAGCRSPTTSLRRLSRTDTILDTSHSHLTAEFSGVSAEQLRDATLLGGLLIAAASAVGFSTIGLPIVKEQSDGGISAVLLLDGAHIAIHSVPERQTLLFDIVAPASHDFRKAVEVFSRRITARDIRSDTRGRG